jgi:hypothetical protein
MDADLRRNRFPPTWHWDCRGIAFFQTRRHAEAIEAHQHMDLLHWWTYCYVAARYGHLHESELAIRAATDVRWLKPDFTMQVLGRGGILASSGRSRTSEEWRTQGGPR